MLRLPVESLQTKTIVSDGIDTMRFLAFCFALICSSLATASQEAERAKFEATFNRLETRVQMAMNEDTLVIGHYLTKNPFKGGPYGEDAFAEQYHPSTYGSSCRKLGVSYIQVRNLYSWDMLAGIICKDKKS